MKKIYLFAIGIVGFWACNKQLSRNLLQSKYLVYSQTFEQEAAIQEFEFTESSGWTLSEGNASMALELTEMASYEPPVRSPHSIALISGKKFGSFILEADIQQTGREYNHQDMCIFFGFQNPSQFYYAHISKAMDDHANQIFVVDNQPRIKISYKTNSGQNWIKDRWHKIKLERNLQNGLVRLYFDDMKQAVMEAKDDRFKYGLIGFGSFDDTGKIDNIRIRAKKVKSSPEVYFSTK